MGDNVQGWVHGLPLGNCGAVGLLASHALLCHVSAHIWVHDKRVMGSSPGQCARWLYSCTAPHGTSSQECAAAGRTWVHTSAWCSH